MGAFCQLPPSNVIDLGKCGSDGDFSLTRTANIKSFSNTVFGEAPDVWYKLELPWPMNLSMQIHGEEAFKSFAVYLLDKNLEKIADNSGIDHSTNYDYPFIALDWWVEPGTYYIVNEGYLDYDIFDEYLLTMTLEGSPDWNVFTNLGTWGDSSSLKSYSRNTTYGFDLYYKGSGEPANDMTYQLTLGCPMSLFISDCGTPNTPSFIALKDESGRTLYRSDRDGEYDCDCNYSYGDYHQYIKTDVLPAGTYRIIVEGMGWNGTIVTNIQTIEPPRGDIMENAIHIGCYYEDFEYSGVCDIREFKDHYQGTSGKDVFYEFELESPMDIVISHCGSEVDGTIIYLLDGYGDCIASSLEFSDNEDCDEWQTPFIIQRDLPGGTYYVVSESGGTDGEITTRIQGTCSPQHMDVYSGNSIFTRSYTSASGFKYLDKIDYFNGFGRLEESVRKQYSPLGSDLVTLQEYDGFNRPSNLWLPAVFAGNDGWHVSPDKVKNAAAEQYGDAGPFSTTVYECSPLGRELGQYGPGADWHNGHHGMKTAYLTNVAGNDTLNCIRFDLKASNDTLPYIAGWSDYPSSELYVTRTEDEDGNASFEFKDKLGQVVLTRRVAYRSGEKELFDTYYLYDDYGNRVMVLPPAALEAMGSGIGLMGKDNPALRGYAYMYRYDSRQRCTARKLPGCNWCLYVYDQANRLVFSQDGNQRARATDNWTYYTYDHLNRLAEQGLCTDKNTVSGTTAQIRNYYDDYSFVGTDGFTDSRFTKDTSGCGKGLLTGQRVYGTSGGNPTGKAFYYDKRGREVKRVEANAMDGYEVAESAYTFTDRPKSVRHTHTASGKPTVTEAYTYSYDHADRLEKVEHKLGNRSAVTLAEYGYDELGRMNRKKAGNAAHTSTYTYNLRGWLTGIGGTKFAQDLCYNTGSGIAKYNGNISSMTWQAGGEGTVRGYRFTYDGLDRMLNAIYGEDADLSQNAGRFNEQVTEYDKNGNIRNLQRYGQTAAEEYGLVDNLHMVYDGNRLMSVNDNATHAAYNNGTEFRDGVKQSNEYAYDANGNLTKDLNRNIVDIQYNCLNLPSKVTFGDGSTITYTYAADGTKRRTVHTIGDVTTTTDYCGNVVYENGVQKYLLTEEGYVTLDDNEYHYYLKDHQGNNRVVVDATGQVEETTNYYPFGGIFASSSNSVQPYKYNGKELDTKNGLNWYDYGARQYAPALGRFTTVDRFAEKYPALSTYQYGANNPVNCIDVNGDSIWFTSQYKDNNLEKIVMHVTGKVLDDSNNNINVSSAINNITKAVKRAYQGNIDGITFETDIQLSATKSMNDVNENDHLFVLTNNIIQPKDGTIYGASNYMGGKVAFIDADYFTGFYDRAMGSRNYGSFTATHELGHLLGLSHYGNSPFNIMKSNGMFYGIKSSQLQQIYANWRNGYLNAGSNYMLNSIGHKRPNIGRQIYVKP